MTALLATDVFGAASHRNMVDALSGPLRAGADDSAVTIDGGRASVAQRTYEPLLLVAPRRSLAAERLRVEAVADDGTVLGAVVFAPYTEAGSFLALYRPPVEAPLPTAAPFELTVRAWSDDDELHPRLFATSLELRLLQGVMGRVAYLLGAEKQRVRRQARELAAMRTLAGARDDALDRFGRDLQVARFAEQLTIQGGGVVVTPRREPDAEYRGRLALYRPWLKPSSGGLGALLEHPGLAPGHFSVEDRGERFAFALRLVAANDNSVREAFLDHVRAVHLMWPLNTPPSNTVHARRYLPAARRAADLALRRRVRERFSFDMSSPALARPLAAAFARAGDCRAALGGTTAWPCLRAQDPAGGSRYELGLGADLHPLEPTELQALADAHAAGATSADPEIAALLAAMTPRAPAEDPDGAWLLEPCGLRTVHRVDADRLYVSHLPFHGLVIGGGNLVGAGAPAPFDARYHARLDPGPHAVLADGLARAEAAWTAGGGGNWTLLDYAAASARWDAAPRQAAGAPALAVIRAAGLPAVADPKPVVTRLKALRTDELATLLVPGALAADVIAGKEAAATELRALVELLRAQWLTAALPLIVSATEVAIVAAVTRLPEAGANLTSRRATGTRWYAEPLVGQPATITRVGPEGTLTPAGPGLTAVMALGYARGGTTAPYELRVGLDPDVQLDFTQYELLMNLLEHAHPLGIAVDTASIRRDHIDLDGDGRSDSLSASLSRSYRPYRPRRTPIAGDVLGPDTPGLQVGVHSTVGVDTLLRN